MSHSHRRVNFCLDYSPEQECGVTGLIDPSTEATPGSFKRLYASDYDSDEWSVAFTHQVEALAEGYTHSLGLVPKWYIVRVYRAIVDGWKYMVVLHSHPRINEHPYELRLVVYQDFDLRRQLTILAASVLEP
jgi:hypothetical protein